jgi:hypothetical protein
MARARDGTGLTAYYFVLEKMIEEEVELFAARCTSATCSVYKDTPDTVTIAFCEPDDALFFMNLFDGEIREEYKILSDDDIAAAA